MDYPTTGGNVKTGPPWYREYLLMSPALIILIFVFGIFIKLMIHRCWLTKQMIELESIEVPSQLPTKNKTTQTGMDPVAVVYDGPSTSKIGEGTNKAISSQTSTSRDSMYVEPMCMVGDFAI